MRRKTTAGILAMTLAATTLLWGCSGAKTENENRKDALSYDDAVAEMETLVKTVKKTEVKNPTMDIYSEEPSEADSLSPLDTFPIMVDGIGDVNVEIAAATEMSADAPDDWLNVVAKNFNKEKFKIDGKQISVSVRKITSGEVVTYVNAGLYKPDVFIPSNYAWGKMLDASGVEIEKVEDRIAGNTAGLLIEKGTYEKFVEKYGEPTVANVLDASIAGDLTFAYTNPYTSSTGLNALTAMLKAFDEDDPLSEKATAKLIEYQKQSPPVAYTTAVLRRSAAKGLINAMVMEEQAYVNVPELKGYEYVPFGIRHDHPVYVFEWTDEDERKVVEKFVEYCKSDESQKLADERGFNRHEDYESQDSGMTGTDYMNAQKVWKKNKNGGRPIVAVFVTDTSGSMDGTPIATLRKSLVAATPYVGDEHYVGLVSYSGSTTINLPIERFDDKQRAYFSGEVKNLTASGGTATYDAVLVALKMIVDKLEEVPDAKPMLFLLTDGDQNEGYSLDRIKGIVGGLQVPVYSIAYNYGVSEDLETLSSINEAAVIKADEDDVANNLRNLFNVNM